jgi:hypothetical protein
MKNDGIVKDIRGFSLTILFEMKILFELLFDNFPLDLTNPRYVATVEIHANNVATVEIRANNVATSRTCLYGCLI